MFIKDLLTPLTYLFSNLIVVYSKKKTKNPLFWKNYCDSSPSHGFSWTAEFSNLLSECVISWEESTKASMVPKSKERGIWKGKIPLEKLCLLALDLNQRQQELGWIVWWVSDEDWRQSDKTIKRRTDDIPDDMKAAVCRYEYLQTLAFLGHEKFEKPLLDITNKALDIGKISMWI